MSTTLYRAIADSLDRLASCEQDRGQFFYKLVRPHMKPFRNSLKLTFISLTLAMTASCATARGSDREFIALPPANDLLHLGEDLDSIVIRQDCAGIYAVRDIPDSWSVSIVADGESYAVTITPFSSWNSRKSEFPLKTPEISVRGRGEWSDCFSMRLKVNYKIGGNSMSREFKLDPSYSKHWRPDDR